MSRISSPNGGLSVTYEAIRRWCWTFGLDYARRLRHRRGCQGDTGHLDELFVKIRGRQQYLWRAVHEDLEASLDSCEPRYSARDPIESLYNPAQHRHLGKRCAATDAR